MLEIIEILLLPYLLTVVLTSSVMSIYGYPLFSALTLLIMLVTLVVFAMSYFVEKHVIAGKFVILLFLFLWVTFISNIVAVGQRESGIVFWEWVLTGGDEAEDCLSYVLALMIAADGFLGMVVYYFSKALYRIEFLALISLVPCVLYMKVVAEVDNSYLVLIAGINLANGIRVRLQQYKEQKLIGKKAMLATTAVFVFAVLFISAVIPKKSEAKYYEQFEDWFLVGDTTSEVSSDFSKLGSFSGNADFYNGEDQRMLYSLYGEDLVYLKRQTFDEYDLKKYRWYPNEDYQKITYSMDTWEEYSQRLQISKLQLAIKQVLKYDDTFAKRYNLTEMSNAQTLSDGIRNLFIRSQNFSAGYFIMPSRGVKIFVNDNNDVKVTWAGAFGKEGDALGKNYSYQIYFHDEHNAPEAWINLGAADFDDASATLMLEELVRILEENDDKYLEFAKAFLRQQNLAREYKTQMNKNTRKISDKIQTLADELTEGLEYDYQKAEAIADYFHKNNYVYDITYRAKDKSPEFFIFESKRGTCSDYATAYVLLARAAGLTVRYAEGYVPNVTTRNEYYEITTGCSHAYPEVYIQNLGWKVYEPTVSTVEENTTSNTIFSALGNVEMDYGLILMIALFAGSIIMLIAIIKLVIPFLDELIFRIRIKYSKQNDTIKIVYKRLQRNLNRKKKINTLGLTPKEFAVIYEREYNFSLNQLISALEELSYKENESVSLTGVKLYNIYIAAIKNSFNKENR